MEAGKTRNNRSTRKDDRIDVQRIIDSDIPGIKCDFIVGRQTELESSREEVLIENPHPFGLAKPSTIATHNGLS